MTPAEAVLVALAGLVAGGLNSAVGSGTLVSFPTLLALGYPPVVANVSNSLGLVPGSVSGAIGYRRELKGQLGRAVRLGSLAALGAAGGALLLLVLPSTAFEAIVPVLIIVAVVLVALQPWIQRKLADRGEGRQPQPVALGLAVFCTAVYGGYFGAAQGVILMALLGILTTEHLQRLNGMKNVFVAVANLVAGLLFVFIADVDWVVVALLAVGSVVGGLIGARIGRRLKPFWLRAVIITVGTVAAVWSFVG